MYKAAGERGKDQAQQKRIMPLKRPNLDVRAEFDLETNGAGKTQAKCKHCKEIVQTAKTVNTARAARLRTHLVSVCQKAPGDIKERAYESGQDAKKAKKTLALMPLRLARCAMCKTKSRPVSLIVTTYKPEKSGHNKNKKNDTQKQKLKLHLSFSETRFGA